MNLEFRERLQIYIFYAMKLHKIVWCTEGRKGAHQYLRLTNQKGIQQKRMRGRGFRRKTRSICSGSHVKK